MKKTERHMPLLVSDEPLDLVTIAKAHEHKQRTDAVTRLIRDGHVRVMEDNDTEVIRLRIDREFFLDRRDEFPSPGLVARLQLAVNAGQSERNRPSDPGERLYDLITPGGSIRGYNVDTWADVAEIGYHNVAKITATVKKRQGGPRP